MKEHQVKPITQHAIFQVLLIPDKNQWKNIYIQKKIFFSGNQDILRWKEIMRDFVTTYLPYEWLKEVF